MSLLFPFDDEACRRHHARLSFAATPEQLREGVRRMAPHWRPRA